jgi:4-hydroxy-tetrahydrodipicolinate synthase
VGTRVKELIRCFKDGDPEGAEAIEHELQPVLEALAVTTNPIPLKAALNLLGHEVGGLRLPLVDASEDEVALVRAGLEAAGILSHARA